MHKYRELKVWQRAMAFVVEIYRESREWPSEELPCHSERSEAE